jgi:hypothetical protein
VVPRHGGAGAAAEEEARGPGISDPASALVGGRRARSRAPRGARRENPSALAVRSSLARGCVRRAVRTEEEKPTR